MEKIKFKNKPRGISGDLKPDAILAELERIRIKNGGRLTTSSVVEEATPEGAVLHEAFEWDDAKAGAAHRHTQARWLIRSIVIVRDEEPPAPAYLSVHVVQEQKPADFYQHTDVIVDRPDEFVAALSLLRRKFAEMEDSLRAAQRLAARSKRTDIDLQLLASIGEALATARAIAERIQ